MDALQASLEGISDSLRIPGNKSLGPIASVRASSLYHAKLQGRLYGLLALQHTAEHDQQPAGAIEAAWLCYDATQ